MEQVKQRVTELEGLVKNGNVLLSELKDNADRTKTEMQRRITELEDAAQSNQTTLIKAQERAAEMEESLTNNDILLKDAREHATKMQAEAQQRVAEMEESLKNNQILLQEATDRAEMIKQEAQRQIAELEKSALTLVTGVNAVGDRQGRESSTSAVPTIISQPMPGGMPSLLEMDVDQEPTSCKCFQWSLLPCLYSF